MLNVGRRRSLAVVLAAWLTPLAALGQAPPAPAEGPPMPEQMSQFGPTTPPVVESWLAKPLSAGVFIGALQGSPLMDDWAGQTQGMLAGLRLGCDFGEQFGAEFRYAFGSTEVYDTSRALSARTLLDPSINVPGHGLEYHQNRHCDLDLLDFSLLWYPTGDTRCRWYFLTGIGLTQIRFTDVLDNRWSKTVPDVPIGVGLKYRCTEFAALRVELTDTIIFGNGAFNNLHDVSLTGGIEVRFGGAKRAYWPWVPTYDGW